MYAHQDHRNWQIGEGVMIFSFEESIPFPCTIASLLSRRQKEKGWTGNDLGAALDQGPGSHEEHGPRLRPIGS